MNEHRFIKNQAPSILWNYICTKQVGKVHRFYNRNRESKGVNRWWYIISLAFRRLTYQYKNIPESYNLWELNILANLSKIRPLYSMFSWEIQLAEIFKKLKRRG